MTETLFIKKLKSWSIPIIILAVPTFLPLVVWWWGFSLFFGIFLFAAIYSMFEDYHESKKWIKK